jgi:hypothetical protein|tara:strand:- start:631 stop:909 length:279 start_codon:yes stop_codon:yes gene_type:complete
VAISRRQFVIYSGLTVSAVAIPSIISSSKRRVINQYNEWKGVTSNQIEELNKYNLDDLLISVIPMLLFAYAYDLFDLVQFILLMLITLLVFI